MTRSSVVVIGGGISGLCAAWELTGAKDGPNDESPRVELIEANEYFGGTLATTSFAAKELTWSMDRSANRGIRLHDCSLAPSGHRPKSR